MTEPGLGRAEGIARYSQEGARRSARIRRRLTTEEVEQELGALATVEDHHGCAVDGFAIDHAGNVGPGRANEKATWLEQDPGRPRHRIGGELGIESLKSRLETTEIE